VITTSESTTLVGTITLGGDGIDAVASSILRSDLQVGTNNSLSKYMLESSFVSGVKLKLVQHWDGVTGARHIRRLRSETVQRHEGNTTGLFLLQDLQDFGGSLVIIDDVVEQALSSGNLNSGSVPVADIEELGQGTVDAFEVVLTFDAPDSSNTAACVIIHHLRKAALCTVHLLRGTGEDGIEFGLFSPEFPDKKTLEFEQQFHIY
jgi:hypothetical protein